MERHGKDHATTPLESKSFVDQHPRPRSDERSEGDISALVDRHPRPRQVEDARGHTAERVTVRPSDARPDRAMSAGPTTIEPPRAPRATPQRTEQPRPSARPGPARIAHYHKGLQHDSLGEVIEPSYKSLLDALSNRKLASFEAIQLGSGGRKLVNPQCGFAEDLEGPNPSKLTMPAAPDLDSAEAAGEAVELYWMAALRDVPFTDFASHPKVDQAAAELSTLTDFRGPKQAGIVTPQTIFRGFTPGDLTGPFVSQFLLKTIPYGSLTIDQRQQTAAPGIDYMTDFAEWLDVQDGSLSYPADQYDGTRRYIRSMRDLGHYVHVDALYEAYLNACLILLGMYPPAGDDPGNPYRSSRTQIGFGTFGGPHVLSLVCEVATRALKAVWYQKWVAHKRLRPEAYGGLIHVHKTGQKAYPLHADILNSQVLAETQQTHGSYLLPMAFPEGSPTHPAYGAGHATVAGACVTILKAWFDEDQPLPNPVETSPDGLQLVPYVGPTLTIGGELDKVAANIAIGRNMAGVHWRSDYTESVKLGEQVATCILLSQSKHDYRNEQEKNATLTFTSYFDGQKRTVRDGELFDAAGKKINFKCPR